MVDPKALRIERLRLRITGRAVADAMGISQARVCQAEQQQEVTDAWAARYRAALQHLKKVRNGQKWPRPVSTSSCSGCTSMGSVDDRR